MLKFLITLTELAYTIDWTGDELLNDIKIN